MTFRSVVLGFISVLSLTTEWHGETRASDFFPAGNMFPCAAYSAQTVPDLLARLRQAGINISGPEYENFATSPSKAAAAGFETIATIDTHVRLGNGDIQLNEDQLKRDVNALSDNSMIFAWYLLPEEIRPWRKPDLALLHNAADLIRATDPSHRPVFTYDPGNRDADQMALTGDAEGILERGIYPNYSGFSNQRIYVRWSIDQMYLAQKKLLAEGHKVALWPALEMFQNPPAGSQPIAAQVRHDVLASISGGAQGLAIFSVRKRPTFTDYDAYINAYAAVLPDICGTAPLGQAALHGTRTDLGSPSTTAGSGEETFTIDGSAHKEPTVRATQFLYQSKSWLVIVNSSSLPVEAQWNRVDLHPKGLLPGFVMLDEKSKTLNVKLTPLQAEIVQIN